PDQLLLAQLAIIHKRRGAPQLEAERAVHVMVQVRAGADHPVDQASPDQRHERGRAQAGRRQRARECHADRHVWLGDLASEQLTGLAQPRRVVGIEMVVDQVAHAEARGDRARVQFDAVGHPKPPSARGVAACSRPRRTAALASFLLHSRMAYMGAACERGLFYHYLRYCWQTRQVEVRGPRAPRRFFFAPGSGGFAARTRRKTKYFLEGFALQTSHLSKP